MKVLVEAKNLEITEGLRQHVNRQAQKLEKLGKKVVSVRVFLETIAKKSNDPQANKVTFKVVIPGKDIVVKKNAVDMYEAVVQAAKGAVRQVRKVAERRITKHRQSHQQTDVITDETLAKVPA